VRFLDRFLGKPIYLFGGFGLLWLAIAVGTMFYVFYLKIFEGLSMIQTPLPVLAAISLMMGVTSILIGLLAEIMVRIYFETRSQLIYHTRETINFDNAQKI
jgi:hypothetical protein